MKLNKKLLSLIAVAGVGVASVLPSLSTVYAATSKATVEFIRPDSAPEILNPDSPETPATPDQIGEGTDTDEFGVLTLDFVSNFNFGTQELSSKNETYYATNKSTPFAQVTDVRGTGEGWRLVAQLGQFNNETGGTASLPGASITLNGAEHVSPIEALMSAAPSSEPPITLSANGDVATITIADEGTGMGSWITRWLDKDSDVEGNENVSLHVPAAVATKGAHTADITWTLYNAPTGENVELTGPTTETTEE